MGETFTSPLPVSAWGSIRHVVKIKQQFVTFSKTSVSLEREGGVPLGGSLIARRTFSDERYASLRAFPTDGTQVCCLPHVFLHDGARIASNFRLTVHTLGAVRTLDLALLASWFSEDGT